FDPVDGGAGDLVHVDEALLFFLDQVLEGLIDLHLPLLAALAEDVGQHVLDVDVHFFDALVRDDFERGEIALADFDFDHALIELAFAQLLAEFFAGARLRDGNFGRALEYDTASTGRLRRFRRGRREKEVEQALLGVEFGFVGDIFELLFPDHVDGDLDQIADHGFDVAADVADLGKLRGFDLEKGGIGELGEAAGDFGFAHAGGPDHDDVLGHHLALQAFVEMLPAPAIANGHGHGPLGLVLPDDVLIEFRDDLPRRHFAHGLLPVF